METMCARYEIEEKVLRRFPGIELPDHPGLRVIRPTNLAPVVIALDPLPVARMLKWGFSVGWSKAPLINAQSETAATKPTWKKALQSHRCLIPAAAWIEWLHEGKNKIPHRFQPLDGGLICMAGLWMDDPEGDRFTMLTREPDATCAKYHDRMPLILPESSWSDWLEPATRDPKAILASARLNDWTVSEIVKAD